MFTTFPDQVTVSASTIQDIGARLISILYGKYFSAEQKWDGLTYHNQQLKNPHDGLSVRVFMASAQRPTSVMLISMTECSIRISDNSVVTFGKNSITITIKSLGSGDAKYTWELKY